MKTNRAAGPMALLMLVGCGGGIKVVRTGPIMDPREDNCLLEFLEDPPTRQYIELAEMTTKVIKVPATGSILLKGATRAQAADSVLHQKACQLGADAVIVLRAQIINDNDHMLIAGAAIRYLPPPAESAPSADSPVTDNQTNPPSP